ncbi:hypothetical protein AVEN_92933-1 [Araneus ventricosus]|uniref:Uncharacterized protein n=1 Tax=Araneus ventricosus TaxID=182803 RepID=A0A4Y2D1Y2_ARAVE|nr:hypothetical protein AVEN_92933-1 [Araneus ventricosus]
MPRHCEGTLRGIVKCRASSTTTALIAVKDIKPFELDEEIDTSSGIFSPNTLQGGHSPINIRFNVRQQLLQDRSLMKSGFESGIPSIPKTTFYLYPTTAEKFILQTRSF